MDSTPSSRKDFWKVMRHGSFARYMAGEAISMTGTWMQVMAQNWVMTSLTSSALMLGMVNFASGLPMVLLSMTGGMVADRCDKRKILLVTQVVQIVLAVVVGRLVATEQIAIWHLLVVAMLLGTSASFEMPADASFVPEMVERDQIGHAIAINRSVFHGTRLIGPALAGYAVGRWGAASAFYLNALSFLAMIVALLTIRPRLVGSAAEEAERRGGLKEGIAYVRSDKPMLALIALMASVTLFVFPAMIVMLPLYSRKVLLLGPDKMGFLMGLSATGSLTGAIALLTIRHEKRQRVIFATVCGIVLALIGLSAAQRFWLAAVCMVTLSLCVSSLVGLANTIVQERAPARMRGRISAIAGLSFFGLIPFASLGITSLADWLGIRTALAAASILYCVAAVCVLAGPGKHICDKPTTNPLNTVDATQP